MRVRKLAVVRKIIAAVVFAASVLPASVSRADYGEWTWISGSDTILQAGTYGTQGVPDADNVPGARYGSAAWTGADGSFWLFGGYGLDSAGDTKNLLNDLWRYDPDNNTWTWVNGADTVLAAGIYGTQGVPAAGNVPGARYSSASWRDSSGRVWLFGGFGLDSTGDRQYLNDLWLYDPDNNTWAWMSGSDLGEQPGIYGTKGTPDADNVPGARYESAAWTDNATGDLWLFGGYGLDSKGIEYYLNDLWRYDPDNSTWTWMSGSDRDSERGTYGEKGIPDEDNMPGSRSGSFAWTGAAGDLWLFGGYGYDKNYRNYLSDLWRYDPDNGTWTWMSGYSKAGKSGRYGAQGLSDEDSVPGARYTGSAWMDQAGDLWLFGGYGYPESGRCNPLNDLWRYDHDADGWTWITGSDRAERPGIYGTKGMPSGANVPGARNGSAAWMDSSGNLWLFGGYAYDSGKLQDYVNDLWRFELPADANMRIDSCSITAGTTDSIKFAGFMDAGEAALLAELGGEIVISLWADTLADPGAATFSFPINADTFGNGKYKSPKSDATQSFSYDCARGTMNFSAKNLDLTGLRCPITLTIEIGAYVVQRVLQEDIVNGTKPCPLSLMMGVLDSLDVSKFRAQEGVKIDTDSVLISGTFTVDGPFDFNTALPVDIMLGPDTFSVPGGEFVVKKGVYSCKSVATSNGIVTAKFDTVKCTCSIKVTKTTFTGSGYVDFSIDLFGYALQYPDQVALP